jgi:Rrf2 family cysteine metabolism transcriptional repressor
MKISKKSYYGLRAVLALAQAEKPLSIHALAETEHLPEDYLEKIVQQLRRSGLVEAKKGTTGGYSLTKPATTITVWEILKELDGPLQIFLPLVKGTLPCLQPSHCQTNEVWRKLEIEIEQSLSQITLASLIPNNISQS